MFVSANIFQEYLFTPEDKECVRFNRCMDGEVVRVDQGYTLAAYQQVPTMVVKDSLYFGAVAKQTRSFDNRQETLTDLQRIINLGDNEIIDVSKGCRLTLAASMNSQNMGIIINHIPQLFALLNPEYVLTGFAGTFDFQSNLFTGQADFTELIGLWPNV